MSYRINSMTGYIDGASAAVRALMTRKDRERTEHGCIALVIVEGETDQIAYTTLLDCSRCYVQPAFGKDEALKAVGILLAGGHRGVIGIIDDDFDSLSGITVTQINVVVTDTHDLETMVLRSAALEKFLLFLLPSDKRHNNANFTNEVRGKLLELGIPLGHLRWLSKVEQLGLNFDSMNYGGFIDTRSLMIDDAAMVYTVYRKSSPCQLSEDEILEMTREKMSFAADPWRVCQGHDLVHILAIVVPRVISKYAPYKQADKREFFDNIDVKMKRRNIEEALFMCFASDHFKETATFQYIKEWESSNQPYTILRPVAAQQVLASAA